jgi:hypothetical protein
MTKIAKQFASKLSIEENVRQSRIKEICENTADVKQAMKLIALTADRKRHDALSDIDDKLFENRYGDII